MELKRSISSLTVRQTRRSESIAIASVGDFVAARSLIENEIPLALPYCFDFLRARAIYVTGLDPTAAQKAPFYYLHLRRNARRLLSVPIEHGPIAKQGLSHDPIFLFSPGRCGSTLLSRVLFEAGIPSVSEPDFYTQMASYVWSSRFNPARRPFLDAMWNLSSDLSAALGGVPVVKLRAECAKAPELFVRNPGARTLVMFRRFEDWARSTSRVFGAGPGKAVRKYLSALRCYDRLCRVSNCQVLRYEDWLTGPAGAAEALGRFLGAPIPPDAVSRATKGGSQDGTPLEGRSRVAWQAKFDGALRLWHTPRLVTARQRLEIPNVWD